MQSRGIQDIDGKKLYFCSNEDLFSCFVERLNPPVYIISRLKKGLKLKGHSTISDITVNS